MRWAKYLIRLRGCVGWSESSLIAQVRFVVRWQSIIRGYIWQRLMQLISGWVLMLKGVAGAPGPDLYHLWNSTQTLNPHVPLASHLTTEFNGHFKPDFSNHWNDLCIDQVNVCLNLKTSWRLELPTTRALTIWKGAYVHDLFIFIRIGAESCEEGVKRLPVLNFSEVNILKSLRSFGFIQNWNIIQPWARSCEQCCTLHQCLEETQ